MARTASEPGPADGGNRPTRLPDATTIRSVLTIAARIREMPLAQWNSESPLVPEQDTDLTLQDLDLAIERDLPSLGAVCVRPHDRLGVEYEKRRADQARRIPAQALTHLAAQSEDWLARTRDGVHPARIMTTQFVEELNFYENQVAVNLVDHLGSHVADRLSEVRRVLRLLEDVRRLKRFDAVLRDRPSWRSRERVSRLLAGWSDVQQRIDIATTTRRALEEQRARLDALRGTRLYRAVSREVSVALVLRSTNLLTGNHRYSKVRRLWEAWARQRVGTQQREEQAAAFPDAFAVYVGLLVLRACGYLGFELSNPDPGALASLAQPGAALVHLGGRHGPASLRRASDGTFLLQRDARDIARIVPVANALTSLSASEAEVTAGLRELTARLCRPEGTVAGATARVLFVYPGLVDERKRLSPAVRPLAHFVGPPPEASEAVAADGPDVHADARLLGLVPVSPLEVDSIERLARGLRWALHGLPAMEYPPVVPLSRPIATHLARDLGHFAPDEDGLALLRPVDDDERGETHRRLTDLGTERTRLGQETDELDLAWVQFVEGAQVLQRLSTCPICGQDRRPEFRPRDAGTYICECDPCHYSWGLRICGRCRRRFPVLLLAGRAVVPVEHGDEIEPAYGNELLAVPCPSGNETHFRCSWCQYCN